MEGQLLRGTPILLLSGAAVPYGGELVQCTSTRLVLYKLIRARTSVQVACTYVLSCSTYVRRLVAFVLSFVCFTRLTGSHQKFQFLSRGRPSNPFRRICLVLACVLHAYVSMYVVREAVSKSPRYIYVFCESTS